MQNMLYFMKIQFSAFIRKYYAFFASILFFPHVILLIIPDLESYVSLLVYFSELYIIIYVILIWKEINLSETKWLLYYSDVATFRRYYFFLAMLFILLFEAFITMTFSLGYNFYIFSHFKEENLALLLFNYVRIVLLSAWEIIFIITLTLFFFKRSHDAIILYLLYFLIDLSFLSPITFSYIGVLFAHALSANLAAIILTFFFKDILEYILIPQYAEIFVFSYFAIFFIFAIMLFTFGKRDLI